MMTSTESLDLAVLEVSSDIKKKKKVVSVECRLKELLARI